MRRNAEACYHGGAFFEFIGDEFADLQRSYDCVNADVLDAWFAPAPAVLTALQDYLPWIVRTSPPTNCEGMIRAIARHRGVDSRSILAGAGSSDLIFLALRTWLTSESRVLILDPTYGEYPHVLEKTIGCRVDRLRLRRSNGYRVVPERFSEAVTRGYDLIVLVNPNSPAGTFIPHAELAGLLAGLPATTKVWIDETYIEYAGASHSFENVASTSRNIVVCKSMSKVYALSGLRAAYLCAHPDTIAQLARITPPWAVSMPGQIGAVMALAERAYYAERYEETHRLRVDLVKQLSAISGLTTVPGIANFVLCHLPEHGPTAAEVVDRCRQRGVYLRDASNMGSDLGPHALRIAVKQASVNTTIINTLTWALQECAGSPARTRERIAT